MSEYLDAGADASSAIEIDEPSERTAHIVARVLAARPTIGTIDDRLVIADPDTGDVHPLDEKRLALELESIVNVVRRSQDAAQAKARIGTEDRSAAYTALRTGAAPTIRAVRRAPYWYWTVDENGEKRLRFEQRPGWNKETGIYLANQYGPMRGKVSQEHVDEVLSVITDYEYASEPDEAIGLSKYFGAFVGPAIRGPQPLHMVVASSASAGKSYTVETCGALQYARLPPIVDASRSPLERQYQIVMALAKGETFMFLDNIEAGTAFGDPQLYRLLTAAGPITIRTVRGSEAVTIDPTRCRWFATGINVPVENEEAYRRIVFERLKSRKRAFRAPGARDRIADVREYRTWIMQGINTLISDWRDAGYPEPPRTLASYNEWNSMVGGPVCGIGPRFADAWLADRAKGRTTSIDKASSWRILRRAIEQDVKDESIEDDWFSAADAVEMAREWSLPGLEGVAVPGRQGETRMGYLLAGVADSRTDLGDGWTLERRRRRRTTDSGPRTRYHFIRLDDENGGS